MRFADDALSDCGDQANTGAVPYSLYFPPVENPVRGLHSAARLPEPESIFPDGRTFPSNPCRR